MKLYRTKKGVLLDDNQAWKLLETDWDTLVCAPDLLQALNEARKGARAIPDPQTLLDQELLPPVGRQEVWASGVTYLRSKSARMEESKEAGGGSFYDRVYDADRPELFFKAAPYRVSGHGQAVRIRRDSKWNVPEPELTLLLNPAGELCGYTVGNDMSSRDIEGENPLYLPQAKSYDGSTALGPCVYISPEPLPGDTEIRLQILRAGQIAFEDRIQISQIKRSCEELAGDWFRERSFPYGVCLMTGTGIVPPNDFTLQPGDEVHIGIPPIGTLVNPVAS